MNDRPIEKALDQLQKAAILMARIGQVAKEQVVDSGVAVEALKSAVATLKNTLRGAR
jgi:hypothetical protein